MLRLRAVQLELEKHRNHLEELVRSRTAELALAKDAAEAANLAKSAFLATTSHELRTPLNAILGLSYLVGRELAEPKLRGQVESIRSAGQQLLGMVDQILDMTRLEGDTLTIEDSDFALPLLLDAPARAWRERAAAKGLGFALELDPALPPFLRGDARRLGQMLAILVDNAIKFSDTGSIELRVRLLETGNDGLLLRFEVTDQGIGIDAAQQALLFNSFAQADSSTTRKYGGIGIGLSICKRLAELMGGKVGAGGTPNAGSSFWFSARLQRGDGKAATAVADRPARWPGGRRVRASGRCDGRGAAHGGCPAGPARPTRRPAGAKRHRRHCAVRPACGRAARRTGRTGQTARPRDSPVCLRSGPGHRAHLALTCGLRPAIGALRHACFCCWRSPRRGPSTSIASSGNSSPASVRRRCRCCAAGNSR
jgi:nitrogen-specific signal transduction histidine kinase